MVLGDSCLISSINLSITKDEGDPWRKPTSTLNQTIIHTVHHLLSPCPHAYLVPISIFHLQHAWLSPAAAQLLCWDHIDQLSWIVIRQFLKPFVSYRLTQTSNQTKFPMHVLDIYDKKISTMVKKKVPFDLINSDFKCITQITGLNQCATNRMLFLWSLTTTRKHLQLRPWALNIRRLVYAEN